MSAQHRAAPRAEHAECSAIARRPWTHLSRATRVGSLLVLAVLAGGVSLSRAAPPETSPTIRYVASATEPATGKPLYREEHLTRLKNGAPQSSETVYFGPRGEKWATLKAKYKSATDRYSHRFDDLRSGAAFGVELDRAGRPIMFNRDTGHVPFERKPYRASSSDPVAVAGQGFHWLIRERILRGELKPGASLRFRLLVPGRFDYFSFRIKVSNERAGLVYLNVTLASLFLRIIADAEMRLIYERSTGRLMEYQGPTAIKDQGGRPIKAVRILYRYPE